MANSEKYEWMAVDLAKAGSRAVKRLAKDSDNKTARTEDVVAVTRIAAKRNARLGRAVKAADETCGLELAMEQALNMLTAKDEAEMAVAHSMFALALAGKFAVIEADNEDGFAYTLPHLREAAIAARDAARAI